MPPPIATNRPRVSLPVFDLPLAPVVVIAHRHHIPYINIHPPANTRFSASSSAPVTTTFVPPMGYNVSGTTISQQQYYDYNGTYTGATTSTFRPNKRPRNLTEEEAAAITRNFQRGDFYVGTSAPVRIDPRLPVRLTLGEGDHVHFSVGEPMQMQ